jgi:hypothetical protein
MHLVRTVTRGRSRRQAHDVTDAVSVALSRVLACLCVLCQGVAARVLTFPIGGTTMNIKNAGNGKGSIEVQTALTVRARLPAAVCWHFLACVTQPTCASTSSHDRPQRMTHRVVVAAIHDAKQEDVSPDALDEIRRRLNEVIAADVALKRFTLDKDTAYGMYDTAMVESSRRPDPSLTSFDMVYIDGLLLCLTTAPLLPSASYLGTVEITKVPSVCPSYVRETRSVLSTHLVS